MAHTQLSGLVAGAEELFNDYVISRVMEKSAFARSGILVPSQALVPAKGKFTHFPYFNEMDGDDEVLSDNSSLPVTALTTGDQVAAVLGRGKAFGVNDLVSLVSGVDDPLRVMANHVGDYWTRRYDRALVLSVDGSAAGLDAAYGAGSIISDISAAAGAASNIDAAASYDTVQLMGEFSSDLEVVVMHSAVQNWLNKQDLIDIDFPVSESKPIKTYLGREIVIDDNVTSPGAGIYHTYFCRKGAVGFADGTPADISIEFDRNILSGNNEMTTRRRFVLHPMGASLDIAGAKGIETDVNNLGFSNSTLGNAGAWAQAFVDPKKYGIRLLKHTINAT